MLTNAPFLIIPAEHGMGRGARRGLTTVAPLILAVIVACSAPVVGNTCATQLASAGGPGVSTQWIDPATPSQACTAQLCAGEFAACDVTSPPLSTMQLVFSDEFESEGRRFDVAAGDPRWTAERQWYWVTENIEVYQPEQVTTADGAAVVTIDRAGSSNATALAQRPNGVVWNVSSAYKSGLVSSWNKFCFTGGYLEARLQLPGDEVVSGFWPALWMMGNLGRAGYAASTSGMWPYTYNTCGGGDVGAEFAPNGPIPQNITACPDPPGFDRTKFGLLPGQGRGAPEIDLVEVMVGSSKRLQPGDRPRQARPGEQVYPHNLLTVQTAPLLPNGTTWTDDGKPGPGQYLPKDRLPEGMVTDTAWWKGAYTAANDSRQYRPGSLYQDAVGAYASLDPSFWTTYHTFGLHWVPEQYIRWYIDGVLVYEVNKEALRAQTNSTGYTTYERLIPVEPMYLIFNLAMSNSFGYVDLQKLEFPSQYKVDYVRVYQNASAVHLGCSPPDFPTQQYLACNREKYILTEEDQELIQGPCLKAPSCRQEANVDLQGGNIPSGDDQTYVQPQQLATVKECCQACQAMAACGAYVYSTLEQMCFFKAPTGWTKVPVADPYWGALAGVVYDAGESWPRGTNATVSGIGSGGSNSTSSGGGNNDTGSGGGEDDVAANNTTSASGGSSSNSSSGDDAGSAINSTTDGTSGGTSDSTTLLSSPSPFPAPSNSGMRADKIAAAALLALVIAAATSVIMT